MPLPFHFSTLNYELAKSTPSGSINIMWNQLGQKMQADSLMYMTPNFNPSIGLTYPEFGIYGNNLLNPCLAIQQTLQSFQNGNWMNNIGGGNWFNNMPWNNWNPWGGGNNNGGNNSSSVTSEYDALKAVIEKYKELGTKNGSLSPSVLDKINNALNKSGTAEEKMTALKDVYNTLNKKKLEKALLELPEYKKMLDAAGYNFNGMNKEEDKKLRAELNSLETDIKAKKGDKLVTTSVSEDNPNILRIVSYWNDTHSDANSKGIIRLVANNLPSAEDEKTLQKEGVTNLAMSLINKADALKAEFEGSFPKLDKAKEEVMTALTNAQKDKAFTKENLLKLADKFDTLYGMLRMMEAERVRNTIQSKYGFLNNISSTDTDFVTDDLVVKSTKEDLANEGITVVETDNIPNDEVEEGQQADDDKEECPEKIDEQLSWLDEKGYLEETKKEGVYRTETVSTTGEKPRFYQLKDGKLVELENVKAVKDDGTIEKIDDTKDVTEKEVTKDDIIDYNSTIKNIESYIKDGKIIKDPKPSKALTDRGYVLYISKGKDENGHKRFFVVRNNKLMKINGVVNQGGTVTMNGTNECKLFSALTDADFTEVTNSDLDTTDLRAAKANSANEGEAAANTTPEASTQKYNAPDKATNQEAYKEAKAAGEEVARKLWGKTDTTDWNVAKEKIESITEDNIHWFLDGYVNSSCNWSSWITNNDNIIEQILDENDPKEERYELMQHIINKTLEHYIQYGGSEENKMYLRLKEACNAFTVDNVENHETFTITINGNEETHNYKDIDRWILGLLNINSPL